MDTVGLITKTVDDVEKMLEILSGPDGKDGLVTSTFKAETTQPKKLKIGMINEVEIATKDHVVEKIDLDIINYAPAIHTCISSAETMSNLARLDGIRYGERAKNAKNLDEIYLKSRGEGLDYKNKLRILTGAFVLSGDNYEEYFVPAQKARTLLINSYEKLFRSYDFLISPIDEVIAISASLAGLPLITLPIGMQIIGPKNSDAKMLAFVKTMEITC